MTVFNGNYTSGKYFNGQYSIVLYFMYMALFKRFYSKDGSLSSKYFTDSEVVIPGKIRANASQVIEWTFINKSTFALEGKLLSPSRHLLELGRSWHCLLHRTAPSHLWCAALSSSAGPAARSVGQWRVQTPPLT